MTEIPQAVAAIDKSKDGKIQLPELKSASKEQIQAIVDSLSKKESIDTVRDVLWGALKEATGKICSKPCLSDQDKTLVSLCAKLFPSETLWNMKAQEAKLKWAIMVRTPQAAANMLGLNFAEMWGGHVITGDVDTRKLLGTKSVTVVEISALRELSSMTGGEKAATISSIVAKLESPYTGGNLITPKDHAATLHFLEGSISGAQSQLQAAEPSGSRVATHHSQEERPLSPEKKWMSEQEKQQLLRQAETEYRGLDFANKHKIAFSPSFPKYVEAGFFQKNPDAREAVQRFISFWGWNMPAANRAAWK